jgi:hypothetical protein
MKITKNDLRNLMTEQRLNDLKIHAVERNILVDYEHVFDIDSLQITELAEYYCAEFLLRPSSSDCESLIFMHTLKYCFTYATSEFMNEK